MNLIFLIAETYVVQLENILEKETDMANNENEFKELISEEEIKKKYENTDLASIDTFKVTDMSQMFTNNQLNELNLSNFKIPPELSNSEIENDKQENSYKKESFSTVNFLVLFLALSGIARRGVAKYFKNKKLKCELENQEYEAALSTLNTSMDDLIDKEAPEDSNVNINRSEPDYKKLEKKYEQDKLYKIDVEAIRKKIKEENDEIKTYEIDPIE